jgi:hypothetical protein
MIKKFFNKLRPRITLKSFNTINSQGFDLDKETKIERFWNQLEKEIMEDKKSHFQKNKPEKNILIADKNSEGRVKEVYYVPLKPSDEIFLKEFSESAAEQIRQGGKIVLKYEIENIAKKTFDYIPLTEHEIEELKDKFPHLYDDSETFSFVLQNGRPLFESLKKYNDENLAFVNLYASHLSRLKVKEYINVPFNTNISAEFQKQNDPHYVKVLLGGRLNETRLSSSLKKIYFDYYNSLVEGYNRTETPSLSNIVLDKLSNRVDKKLLVRTKILLDYLSSKNISISFETNTANIDESYIFDKLLIKGVYQDREKNGHSRDYILVNTFENLGIRYFMNKYFTSYASRYRTDKDLMTSMVEYNADSGSGHLSHMKEANRNFILRISMVINHPYKLGIGDIIQYPDKGYKYTHLAVFENELISPPPAYLASQNFEEWLARHYIDPNGWKLVDIDGFMGGNSFFKETEVGECDWEFLKGKLTDLKINTNDGHTEVVAQRQKLFGKKESKELAGIYSVKTIQNRITKSLEQDSASERGKVLISMVDLVKNVFLI